MAKSRKDRGKSTRLPDLSRPKGVGLSFSPFFMSTPTQKLVSENLLTGETVRIVDGQMLIGGSLGSRSVRRVPPNAPKIFSRSNLPSSTRSNE